MALLTREQLLKRDTLKKEKVDLGDGDYVYIRQMTGRERDLFEKSILKEVKDEKGEITFTRDITDFRAKMVTLILCDEDGKNLLEPEDYQTLSQNISAKKLEVLAEVAQRLNKVAGVEQKAEIDRITKNCSGDMTGALPSGSVAS